MPSTPVSGRYFGYTSFPKAGSHALDLRVDIDERHANSPVMHRVSGDIFGALQSGSNERPYQESWIVDEPKEKWLARSVEITGSLRYWNGRSSDSVVIVISVQGAQIGPATITIQQTAGESRTYICDKKSNAFREVTLEVDVCASVNLPPIYPAYDTNAHPNKPKNLLQRKLTIEEAYLEAGIEMTKDVQQSKPFNDSVYSEWSADELHHAMEEHFSQIGGTKWPKWNIWTLLAGKYVSSLVSGLMFDIRKPPTRQGCAIFCNNSYFADLYAGAPGIEYAAALRCLLYHYVHEIGHCFNLLHSNEKFTANPPCINRPEALSWMNYFFEHDELPGKSSGDFWKNFCFKFDDDELIHLRHGDRDSVIMGGQPWGGNAALINMPQVNKEAIGEAPIELIVRSKSAHETSQRSTFHFLEPITVELKLKPKYPIKLPTELSPEFGNVLLFIQGPNENERILPYLPLMDMIGDTAIKEISPDRPAYQNILISYGKYGHYFDKPGKYKIKAFYQGLGKVVVSSGIHEIHIKEPESEQEKNFAKYFHTRETGLALYLDGSDSHYLKKGMAILREMAEVYKENPIGAQISVTLAENLKRPFSVVNAEGKRELKRDIKPRKVINFIDSAKKQQERDDKSLTNITYHEAIQLKVDMLKFSKPTVDWKGQAEGELDDLSGYLKERGVKQFVLDGIEKSKKKLCPQ